MFMKASSKEFISRMICKDLSDSSYFKAGAIESEAEKGSKNLRVSLDDYSSNVQFGISVFTV